MRQTKLAGPVSFYVQSLCRIVSYRIRMCRKCFGAKTFAKMLQIIFCKRFSMLNTMLKIGGGYT